MSDQKPDNKYECFVSVVSVIENVEDIIQPYLENMERHLDAHFTDYEIVLVDQCSKDGTADIVDELLKKIHSIRYIRLATQVYGDVALAAGMENAIGDFVVLFTLGQDPVECVFELIRQAQAGSDIVVGTSEYRRTLGYRIVRPWIQWALHSIGYNLPRNSTSLRCLSRRTVNAVTQTGRFHHQFYVRIANTGYPTSAYPYTIEPGGIEKRTLLKALRQGARLLVFNSTKPLRWMSSLGLLGSGMAFMFASYSLLIRLFRGNVIEGWTTLVLFTSVLFMLLFLIMAFFGEYLGRLLDDRSEQRDYSVANEKNSSVMLTEERHNVLVETSRTND